MVLKQSVWDIIHPQEQDTLILLYSDGTGENDLIVNYSDGTGTDDIIVSYGEE
jgi:hypothetical protein